jgi:hypothetical protein
MLIVLVANLFLLSWWRLAAAVLSETYASIPSIASTDVAIKQRVFIRIALSLRCG